MSEVISIEIIGAGLMGHGISTDPRPQGLFGDADDGRTRDEEFLRTYTSKIASG